VPPVRRLQLAAALCAAGGVLSAAGVLVAAGHLAAGLALGTAILAAGLGLLHALWPRFDLLGGSVRRGPRGSRVVALTFDDGPAEDTPAILAALEASRVRATFFVLGEAARRRPELLRAAASAGHEVALHGDTHARLAFAGPGRIAQELDRCAAAIRAAGVESAPLFRAPHG
jgi:peptidoglycan-N-acetylglucosamine deacetylase